LRRTLRNALPPGPRAPALLQLLGTWTRPTASLEGLRRYGKRVTVQLPFQPPFVVLSDPADIKELFTAAADAVHPGEGARILEPIVGRNSVILLDERAHLAQRRLLLPAFHGERMQRLNGVMTELAEREVQTWPSGEPVALHPRLQRLTLEIILQAVFGLERGPQLDRLRNLLTEVLAFGESPLSVLPPVQRALRWTRTQRRFNQHLRDTDELIFALIEERRAAATDGRPEGDDVLAMLLGARHEDDSPMTQQELRDELMTALVAGHETTASQLAWAFERLAREPATVTPLAAERDPATAPGAAQRRAPADQA
jgi:cytochrome P450